MSKCIFQATHSDPVVPDASVETEDDEEPGKSWNSSSNYGGKQSLLKSLKTEEQTGEATEEESASDADHDDQQTPTSDGQGKGSWYVNLFLSFSSIFSNK